MSTAIAVRVERTPALVRASTPILVPGVLLCSLVLLRLPALFPSGVAFVITLLPFIAAAVVLALAPGRWRVSTWLPLALGYVLLIVVAAYRAHYVGTIDGYTAVVQATQVTVVSLIGALAFLREADALKRSHYLRALCWAPVAFVAVNVLLYTAGITVPGALPPQEQQATTLGLFGISANRVNFPLVAGVNSPVAGIALAVCLVFAFRKERRNLAIIGVLVSVFALLAVDSRGAILFGALAAAFVLLIPRVLNRGFGWIAITLPVLPLLLTIVLTNASTVPVVTQLSRPGATESITTGTGRTEVWGAAASALTEPRFDNVFGYGLSGQQTSGVSHDYAYLFRGEADPTSHSVHNGLLQTALDVGWMGALALIVLAAAVLRRLALSSRDGPVEAALLAGVLALLLTGIVEAVPTSLFIDSFGWWLLALFVAIRASSFPRAGVRGAEYAA